MGYYTVYCQCRHNGTPGRVYIAIITEVKKNNGKNTLTIEIKGTHLR